MKRSLLTSLALLVSCLTDGAEPPERPTRPAVLVQVEWIEVTHRTLTELMGDAELVADGTTLRVRLQEMVKRDEARIYDTNMVTTRSGRRAQIYSVREWIYPVDPEPATPPSQVGPLPNRAAPRTLALKALVPPTPSSFATRNVGTTFEVEPVVGRESQFIDLQLALELTEFQGIREHGKRKLPGGMESSLKNPEFERLDQSSAVTVAEGEYVLLGVFVRSAAPEKRLLVMVRADVVE